MNKKQRSEIESDPWSFIKDVILKNISASKRQTSEVNRKRIAVLLTEAMLEAGIFASGDLDRDMFNAVRYEQALFHALKDTNLSCEPLPEEESFDTVKLMSESWTEMPESDNPFMIKTLNLIKEVIKGGIRSGISELHSRTTTAETLGNRKETTGPLKELRSPIRENL